MHESRGPRLCQSKRKESGERVTDARKKWKENNLTLLQIEHRDDSGSVNEDCLLDSLGR